MGISELTGEEQGVAEAIDPLLRRLLETLPVGAYACDADGLITCFNQQAVELWGRAPRLNHPSDRWCGSFKLHSAADGSPVRHEDCWMATAIKTGVPQNAQEIVVERPSGEHCTVLVHANPIHNAAGALVGAVNVLVDISDRKRAEEAQSKLGAIVESSDDAIIGKTLDGRILSWNAGAQRIFGYTVEEAVGQPITLIIPPERLDEEAGILAKLCAGERVEHYETVRLTKDGRRLDISLTSSPIRNAAGRVIGASKVARDITAKKRDEAALHRLQEMSIRLATSLNERQILEETLQTAAAIIGAERGLLSVRKGAEVEIGASLGFEEAFLDTLATVPADQGGRGRCFREGRRVLVGDVESEPELKHWLPLARAAGIRAAYHTPMTTRSGKVLGVLSVHFGTPRTPSEREKDLVDLCARQAVDFMENARLYNELQEADRTKNDFLATLAHELRNPLAPIRNTVEMLQRSDPPTAPLRSALGVMERQLSHMTRLIDDLLDVSRITQNKLELRKERVELADVLHAAVEASRPLLTERGHDFGVDLPPEPIVLDADLTRLAQVVSNLLNNASKYTESGGRIRLTGRREGREAVITVRDTGIGIPPELQGRIFEMFAQVDRSLERSQGGLGIGLHLAQRLVGMHGGVLSVRSEGAGAGSEFRVRIPLPAAASPAAGPEPDTRAPLRAAAPLRILVVDDNRDAADSLALLLGIPGNQVHVAYDGPRAIEMAEEVLPDVILLDIGLPRLNGYATAERIREQPWGKPIVLIALTGWGQQEARQRSQESGFDAHLVKPVDPAALIQQLAGISRSRS
ncbi:MAG TPA: PAS domain S-box protein [Gemmatimonadales bacterium]